jgi:hypothetical protein
VVLPLADADPGLLTPAEKLLIGSALQAGAQIPWTDVTGKRATFPPSAHGHAIADVTGLQAALDGKQAALGFTPENAAQKGVANGYAGLDGAGKINPAALPAIAITERFVVASQAAMLALTAETGDVAIRTDVNRSFILSGNPTILGNWQELLTPTDQVSSVFGRTGVVTAQAGDYTTTQVTEGTGLYFTEGRVRSTVLTGFAAAGARAAIAATDSIVTAFGKVQKWLNDLAAVAFTGSAADLTTGTLPTARFDDTSHGSRTGGALHAAATGSVAGFMSGADKTKLDGIAAGAQVNVPTDLGYDAATRLLSSSTGADVTLPLAGTTNAGLAPARSGVATQYLDGTGAYSTPPGGGGGSATITEVEVNFTTPAASRAFAVTVPGAVLTQRVIASISGNMPAGLSPDELEMDPLTVSGFVSAANTVTLFVASAIGSRIRGPRNINLILA